MNTTGVLLLTNLAAWSLQVVLLTAIAAGLLRLLDIAAPVLRHASWRILLLICLCLPVLQPWRTVTAVLVPGLLLEIPATIDVASSSALVPPSPIARLMQSARMNWPMLVGVVLVAGTIFRLGWLAAGFMRLRQLRKSGEAAVPDRCYVELSSLIEAGAEVRYVPCLGQPVTFGFVKPVVLLPDAFPALAAPFRQAVLAHELWHVRRRDWLWVLAEELVRAALWFNPAIWWLVSRIQSTREEVIDELTVQVTNARKTYIEALLAFADKPMFFPATPFARRRHLFQRVLLISREAVMSSRRIVASTLALAVAIVATAWYGAAAFPLAASASAPAQTTAQPGQRPPRDRRPGEAGPETTRERELKAEIAGGAAQPSRYLELARLQEARNAMTDAQETLEAARRYAASDSTVLPSLASFYNRSGQFDKTIATLEEIAAMTPSDPKGYHVLGTFYFEKASKDAALVPIEKLSYAQSGVAAEDRALALNPDYMEAIVYKSLLTRLMAGLEPDESKKAALLAEATALRSRAQALQAKEGGNVLERRQGAMPGQPGLPPPPPPPPPPVDGQAPIRIGGNIKPPAKLIDVRPIYPQDALDAKVQGVVIMEVILDTVGNVEHAKVLKGVPMLNEAALDSVRQWKFEPTQLNGAPVPAIMTVTVNFSLQ